MYVKVQGAIPVIAYLDFGIDLIAVVGQIIYSVVIQPERIS